MSTQDFERGWWGDCANTYGEETKQLAYAQRMGLELRDQGGPGPVIDLAGRSVLDLGGGPASLLLKTVNGTYLAVVDPLEMPDWVGRRYAAKDIALIRSAAEDFRGAAVRDEAWIYNCLQHVADPEAVIATARAQAQLLRIFEWLEVAPHEGHPHQLHADNLNRWIGGHGTIENINDRGAVGLAYYGVFPLA